MRPARVVPDAAHAGARLSVFDSRLLRSVPDFPPALVGELVAHERDNVLERNSRLLETRSHGHDFAARHMQRAVQRRARDAR